MSTTRSPRKGSLQYRPRVRAKRQHARVRTWVDDKSGKPLGFAGFKAGMTHVLVVDNRKNSPTKGREISVPVTILECPPLIIAGVRFYSKNTKSYGERASTDVHFKPAKQLSRTTKWKETGSLDKINPEDYTKATLLVHTQPYETNIGQKKPQIFEIGFSGSVSDVVAFAKENKKIDVSDVITQGCFFDTHSVTKGKGTVGPVKRFGISLRSHKSEKSVRKAVLGPEGYAKVQFTAPQGGKMGYHLRTEYNKQIMAVLSPEQVAIKGGLVNYGNPKNTVVLIKGSVAGPKKRLITLSKPLRQNPKASTQPMEVVHVSIRSQQGNQ